MTRYTFHRFFMAVGLLAVLLAGCIPIQRVIWSPDGDRAIVLGEADTMLLYLCDGDGALTGPLASNINAVAWLEDSASFVAARVREIGSWADLEPLLDEPTRAWVTTHADDLLAGVTDHAAWEAAVNGLFQGHEATAGEIDAMKMFLVATRSEDIPQPVREGWGELNEVTVATLETARLEGDRLAWSGPLASSLTPVFDMRVAPGGGAVAFTTGDTFSSQEKPFALRVVRMDEPGEVITLAPSVAMYPDWSTDGEYLVYAEPVSGGVVEDEAALGLVMRRKAAGGEDPEELAVLVFSNTLRTRCLPDGRILFAASEVHLPTTLEDVPAYAQLFFVEPDRPGTLTRVLPRSQEPKMTTLLMQLFEVSPDGQHVAVTGEGERYAVFALADGMLRELSENTDASVAGDFIRMLPSWRGPGELCFTRPVTDTNQVADAEVVLRSIDGEGESRPISRGWPDELGMDFLD